MRGKRALIKQVACEGCGLIFECKDTKRNRNRKFCSSACAKRSNGKRNKGRRHTEESKRRISEGLMGEKNPFFGKNHTDETKFLISEANKGRLAGDKNPMYKDGFKRRPDGYIRISATDKYVHRVIMEEYIGRELSKNEVIHHINGNTSDNRIENLELTTNSEHRKLHSKTQNRDNHGRYKKQ